MTGIFSLQIREELNTQNLTILSLVLNVKNRTVRVVIFYFFDSLGHALDKIILPLQALYLLNLTTWTDGQLWQWVRAELIKIFSLDSFYGENYFTQSFYSRVCFDRF